MAGVIVVTLAVGIWFFFLRGGGSSEFLDAHERFVASEQAAEAAMAEVERFGELETFNAAIDTQRAAMSRQVTIFNRLATEEGGDDARLAAEASASAVKVLESLDTYAAGVLDSQLADAAFALVQMRADLAALDAVVTEWKNLQ